MVPWLVKSSIADVARVMDLPIADSRAPHQAGTGKPGISPQKGTARTAD